MARDVLQPRLVRTLSPKESTRAPSERGFTLVELSVVVAIIGVLAVIAVIGYRKYILYTKITEAQNTISAIKIAQEDYRAEKGLYADIGLAYCPTGAGTFDKKWGWDPNCGTGAVLTPTWQSLPVHIDGPVQFAYATKADVKAFSGAQAAWVTWGAPNPDVPWFTVVARCDLDGNPADITELAASNFSNQIFSRNEGQ